MNEAKQEAPKDSTPADDLNLLKQVAQLYKGTLQEHVALQNAINRLEPICQVASAPQPVKRGRPKGSKNRQTGNDNGESQPEA